WSVSSATKDRLLRGMGAEEDGASVPAAVMVRGEDPPAAHILEEEVEEEVEEAAAEDPAERTRRARAARQPQ
ncbi:MAG: hypothetical protein KC656_30840, partial [Myxococcales bacterium]|nr:hypothetical protein [Myxococcales bacterium]